MCGGRRLSPTLPEPSPAPAHRRKETIRSFARLTTCDHGMNSSSNLTPRSFTEDSAARESARVADGESKSSIERMGEFTLAIVLPNRHRRGQFIQKLEHVTVIRVTLWLSGNPDEHSGPGHGNRTTGVALSIGAGAHQEITQRGNR